MAITIAGLRGLYPTVTFNDDGYCYTATAPEGHTLDGDLHEYVAEYKIRAYAPPQRQKALDDLAERLKFANLPECTGLCDWCGRD